MKINLSSTGRVIDVATNMATSRLHLKNVAYVITLCICISSSRALALDDVLKISPCPAACNCSQGEDSNKYLAVCAGSGAAFKETVQKLQKDVTNFTFVLQTPGETAQSVYMHDLGHLINLETFIITSTLQNPFKYSPYRLQWQKKPPVKLVNLTTLQINIFISEISPPLNCTFPLLEEFDLSNTRMQFFSPSAISYLLKSTSPSRLRVLNFHFSIAATYPFGRLDFYKVFESPRQWEHIEIFDFSQNGVSTLSPGVYRRLPKLKYINLSNNMITTRHNGTGTAILELLLHPMLKVIDLSNQRGAEVVQLRAKRTIRTVENQFKACSTRIVIQDTKSLCSLFYCTLLSKLQGYFPCEVMLPGIFDFSSQCWLGIYFPLGQNIRELYLSNFWRISYQLACHRTLHWLLNIAFTQTIPSRFLTFLTTI